MTQKRLTFKQRTANLETVKFALARGYTPWTGNIDARKHFSFYHLKDGAPNIHISWFDMDEPNIKVGNMGTRGDERALRLLEEYWIEGKKMVYYDIERRVRPSDQPWFECAKCGAHVTESEWSSLCQDCGEQEADLPRSLTRKREK